MIVTVKNIKIRTPKIVIMTVLKLKNLVFILLVTSRNKTCITFPFSAAACTFAIKLISR